MDGDEIRRRLSEQGKKQVDLAAHLGMAPNKLTKSLNGERRFQVAEMDKIREFLEEDRPPLKGLPLIGDVPAGKWREAIRDTKAKVPKPDPDIPDRAFALKVRGDSMDRLVQDGGTVIIDPDDTDLFPKRFYVVMVDGETTFKQFMADPARLVPCSHNPAHSEIRIGGGQSFEVVGRVIWQASRV